MRLGRKKREDALLEAVANLSANYVELEKKFQKMCEEIESRINGLSSAIAEKQESESKNMIDDDGNYSYQKLKQRSLDRKKGEGKE